MDKITVKDALSGKHDEALNIALCEWLGWAEISHGMTGIAPNGEEKGNRRSLPQHITSIEALGHCE